MVLPGLSAAPLLMTKRDTFNPSLPWGTAVEGGFYMGQVTDAGQLYAIIVAPKVSGQAASKMGVAPSNMTTGVVSETNGPVNTDALFAIGSPAAIFCKGLTIAGKADWYLPARTELTAVASNRSYLPAGEEYTANATSDIYWSSTEWLAFPAYHWGRQFVSGAENAYAVASSQWVRAIRRVKI